MLLHFTDEKKILKNREFSYFSAKTPRPFVTRLKVTNFSLTHYFSYQEYVLFHTQGCDCYLVAEAHLVSYIPVFYP